MKILITGGCGFLGSNIAKELLNKGHDLVLLDSFYRLGSNENFEWLKSIGKFEFINNDIRNTSGIEKIIKSKKFDVIYHLAGQVAMTTSISDPKMDFEVNAIGTFNLLNSVRLYSPESIIIYSSTNKVYGDLEQFKYIETKTRYQCVDKPNGFDEETSLDFHSPYGTSKGCADQYMLDFSRIYGLKTVVFRHSSMFGGRQYATVDQGWLGWFVQKAIEIKNSSLDEPFTISGNGKQVRDLLHASDCVNLYLKVIENIDLVKGKAFNIGGGIENSSSLIELFDFLESELDIKMIYKRIPPRDSDQRVFVANYKKIQNLINWKPKVNKEEGIRMMINWLSES